MLITGLGIPMLVVWAKEIEHVLVDGCWRMIQNCRVYQSAQFLNTDHRLVVATLKLQLKSGRMVPSQPTLDVGKLKDERLAEELGIWGVWVLWGILKICGMPSRPPPLMLSVDDFEITRGRRRILSLKGHWIPLISHRAKKSLMVELSCSGS